MEEISKTQLKKQSQDVINFGKEIAQLSQDQLKKLGLPQDIVDAISEYKKIKSLSAKKRQLLFIGRLLRAINLDKAHAQYDVIKNHSQHAHQLFHLAEQWRDKLILTPDSMTDFINHYPKTDVQQLRSILKNAITEKENNSAPKSSRSLFKIINQIIKD